MSSKPEFDEPPLDEILDDPIVRLIMKRDGIGPNEVRAAMDQAWARGEASCREASSDRAADTGDRTPPTRV